MRRALALAALIVLASCRHRVREGGAPPGELSVRATARRNPAMVVSAFVDVEAKGAELVVVHYGDDAKRERVTPKISVDAHGRATALLVGLLPGATTEIEVEAHAGPRVATTTLQFTTAPLPPDVAVPEIHVTVDDGTARGFLLGAYVTPKGKVATVFDRKGRVLWYRPLLGEAVGVFARMPNGRFVVYDWPARLFEEVDIEGTVVRRWVPKEPAAEDGADGHEFLPLPDDRALVIGWQFGKADTTKRFPGGVVDAIRRDNSAIEMSVDGTSRVIWSSKTDVALDEIQPIPEATIDPASFEVSHMDAIDFSGDLYAVTCRELRQVIVLEKSTGKVRYRLGGKKGDLNIVGDPLGGPSAMHDARLLPGNRLRVFDNGNAHAVQESRVVTYEIDEAAHVARMVDEFRHDPPIYTWVGGSVRALPEGRLLVNYTWKGIVTEIDETKKVHWEMKVPQSGAYRVEWIPTLYP